MRDRLAVLSELFGLLRSGRNWWLLPIVVGLALAALLTVASSALPLAPFVYPLF